MNMFCKSCGSRLVDNSAFCNQCGMPQSGPANSAPVNPPLAGGEQFPSGPMPFAQDPRQAYGAPAPNNAPYRASSPLPPPPSLSTSQTGQKGGFIIALVGGLAAILAFFAMPFLTYFNVISLTGVQLASYGYQGSQYSSSYQSSSTNGLLFLWLLPIIAGLIILIGGVSLVKSGSATEKQTAAAWLIGLGAIAIIGLIGAYIYLSSQIQSSTFPVSLISVLGSGVWVYIISMIAVIVGGILQRRASA